MGYTITMPTLIGIDLGTTNSLVAYADRGVPTVILDETGEPLLPSVVYFPADANAPPVVGEIAKKHLSTEPERTVYSAKRLMGKGLADAESDAQSLSYGISPDFADSATIDLGQGRVVSPPEVAAHILRTLQKPCGSTPQRYRGKSRRHGSRVFQRRAAAGHQRRRSKLPDLILFALSTNQRRQVWPTACRTAKRRLLPSMI